jgi:hypothetical protein
MKMILFALGGLLVGCGDRGESRDATQCSAPEVRTAPP